MADGEPVNTGVPANDQNRQNALRSVRFARQMAMGERAPEECQRALDPMGFVMAEMFLMNLDPGDVEFTEVPDTIDGE